jgi:adenylate cyclase
MATYSRAETAERAGTTVAEVDKLVELGILVPGEGDRFAPADSRRASLVQTFQAGGIAPESLAEAIHRGEIDFAFMDDPAYERFAARTGETFRQASERTGIPVELLMVIREAIGSALPTPDDHMREDELAVLPVIALEIKNGFRPIVIERFLRVMGDSIRRIAETEADLWRSEVLGPLYARGLKGAEIGTATAELSEGIGPLQDAALVAVMHAHQQHTWTSNIIGGFEAIMANAGLQTRPDRPPAMCFLDITGYTRLTQERGDEAAAGLAATLSRLVQRTSVQHGGRPVKWLGDGVMFFFPNPGPGVVAALEMVDGVAGAGLPPAHVGLHAGPVIFQEGDYYGQTVNLASRIAEYARPGEVLVSQAVVDASTGSDVAFREIGPVELKGVGGAVHLHAASRG